MQPTIKPDLAGPRLRHMNSLLHNNILADLRSPQPKSEILQKIGILLFSFGVWSFREIAVVGLAFLLLGAIISWRQTSRCLTRSPTGILSLMLIAYIALSMLYFSLEFQEHALLTIEEGARHIYLFGFLLFALALRANVNYIWPAIALAMAGFFIGRFVYLPDLVSSSQNWWSTRHALGFPTAIPMGQYAFAVMLGLLIFFPRLTTPYSRTKLLIWLLSLAIVTQFIVISQSRSVWLIAPAFIVFTAFMAWRLGVTTRRTLTILGMTAAVIIFTTSTFQYQTIQKRITKEPETWAQLFKGAIEAIPSTRETGSVKSIGIRVNMIEFGFEKWAERPLFGWGPGSSKMLIQCCAPDSFKKYNDLHSAYPETLLRFGLIGVLIGIALVASLFRDMIAATRNGSLPKDIFLFVLICLALHFVVAIGNYRVINYDWRFYWIFFAGIAMAFSPYFSINKEHPSERVQQG